MRLPWLTSVAWTAGFACADVETEVSVDDLRGETAHLVMDGTCETPVADVCDVLPAEGPCAAGCDREALITHVPAGTCAAFYCELTDGRTAVFHACRP